MLNEFKQLVDDYIKVYWKIKEDTEALTAEQRNTMQAELLKQFNRDCARLEGADGLVAERERAEHENELKRIEENKKLENAKTDAEYKLQHAELTKRTELKAAEIQQNAELEKARIESEKIMRETLQQKEIEIRTNTELEILNRKADYTVPVARYRKYGLLRRWRPNEAYVLMAEKARLETCKYLAERKNEIIKLQAELSGSEEIEVAIGTVFNEYIKTKRGRKATAAATVLTEILSPLCAVFARREHAYEDLIAKLSKLEEVDDGEPGKTAVEQPDENKDKELLPNESGADKEREELQNRAVSLIIALCERRISEKQQEQIKKPARKRVRKKPDKMQT